ncbi:MAG TPA: TIGR03618 family F420-dependent PPOX class oxidoreductase [Actinomycetota bacterium]|nr:TIGR03618 family F420-dependent PPOX class oxidoreductase [Actinomycetota bacterium]
MTLPESVSAAVTSGAYAHVTTLNADGSPHVSLAWTGIEDDEIVIGTLSDQRKLQNVRRDPRVVLSFEFDRLNEWGLREYLVVTGRARVTEGGAPELLQKLARIYLGPDVTFPPMPNPPAGFVTRVSVDRISGVGPWASE